MSPNRKKPSVLICDDEEGVRESFRVFLADDYQLLFAKTGIEALELLKTRAPDALLLDLKMPKQHGMEILKQAKQLRPELPVIIVTGYQSVEMAQEALRNGAADYIPKPFDPERVLKSLGAALRSPL